MKTQREPNSVHENSNPKSNLSEDIGLNAAMFASIINNENKVSRIKPSIKAININHALRRTNNNIGT